MEGTGKGKWMEKKGNGNGKMSNGRKGEGRRNIHGKDKKVGGRRGRGGGGSEGRRSGKNMRIWA